MAREPSPLGQPALKPLVLAIHPTRAPLRLTLEQAHALARSEVDDWRDLGEPPAGLRTVDATNGGAAAAVRTVARDSDSLALLPAEDVDPRVQAARVHGIHPLRAPHDYPLRVPGPEPPTPAVVSVVGDIMLGRGVGDAAAESGDVSAPLRPTSARLAAADLTLGNLESTLSEAGPPRQGDDSFAADPRVVSGLRDAGFDVLSVANNHTGDYGPRALVETVRRVARSGIVPVGAGANRGQAWRAAVVDRAGLRFGVLAFNAIGETPRAGAHRPGAASVRMQPRTGPLHAGDLRTVTDGVERLARRVDVVIVVPHWGDQYTNQPVPDQRVVSRALVDAGADLVVGGHPHWVQGVSWRGGAFVAHSLGNFVFDMDFMRETQQGMILTAVFWADELKAVELVPVRIGPDFAPRVVHGDLAREILSRVWATSNGPFRSAP